MEQIIEFLIANNISFEVIYTDETATLCIDKVRFSYYLIEISSLLITEDTLDNVVRTYYEDEKICISFL